MKHLSHPAILAFLFLAASAHAQGKAQLPNAAAAPNAAPNGTSLCGYTPSAIKFGIGLGTVPYEGGMGLGGEMQYEHSFPFGLSVFVAAGTNATNYRGSGRSQGFANGVSWDNSYSYKYSERLSFLDLGLRTQVLRLGERYTLKAGAGVSAVRSVFEHPKTLVINRGIIVQREDGTHRASVLMLNFGLDNDFQISPRWVLGLRAVFRATDTERHTLTRVINIDNGTLTTTSGIRNTLNLGLSLGYLF